MKRWVNCNSTGLVAFLAFSLIFLFLAEPTYAQKTFYKGKLIKIVVGYQPGGGFDSFSRLLARHLKRHIPGNPGIIVQNLPGAGSLVAANLVYAMQPADGLTIANFHYNVAMQSFIGDPAVKFDPMKYNWLGEPSIGSLPRVLFVRSDLGIRNFDDLMKRKESITLGDTARGTGAAVSAQFLHSIGIPVRNVLGYRGSRGVFAALERKEVDGRITSQESVQTTYRRFLEEDIIRPILSLGSDPRLKRFPGVATEKDLKLDAEQQKLMEFLITTWSHLRIYGVPPGVPQDRLAILRNAFEKTFTSPDFEKDAERQGIIVSPSSWQKIDADMKQLSQTSPKTLKLYRKLAGIN